MDMNRYTRQHMSSMNIGSTASSFLNNFDINADINVSNRAPFIISQGYFGNGSPVYGQMMPLR